MTDVVVEYALPVSTPAFQHVHRSRFLFDDTVDRLKQAIHAEDLLLIHEIDPQMLLRRSGYKINATRQLLFFHPRYMSRLLAIDANALIEAPLKLVVMEMPDNSVTVRHLDVASLFARYKGLDALAIELSSICRRLVETVAE